MNGYQGQYQIPIGGGPPHQSTYGRDKSGSPLRTKDQKIANTNVGMRQPQILSPSRDEEEQYERRRQEELRKQFQPLPSTQQRENQYESGSLALSNSFARSNGVADPYVTGKSNQSQPERDKPFTSHFTLGPPQQISNNSSDPFARQQEQQMIPPPHLRDHLNAIQNDNSSLMRRLNLVMQELDRVNREKDDIYQRLKQSAIETSELQKILQSEDNVDKVNNYMRDDLVYERDRNHKIKQQIKDLDLYRNELMSDLRKLQETSDKISRENQELGFTINQRVNQMDDLEKELYFTNEKIKQLNYSIEDLKQELLLDSQDKLELDRIIIQLQNERNDLLSKLELLNRRYDECVREISHDRKEMELHNKKHAKLITSKVLFQMLDGIYLQRFKFSIQKMKEYCEFDEKTHNKLSTFAKVLEKAGHYRMKIGFIQWFSLASMPINVKKQSKLLAQKRVADHLKLKYFIVWHKTYQQRIRNYELKNQAVQRIWSIRCYDLQQEMKRAFMMWKDKVSKFNLRKTRVKKLVWKLYFNKLSGAFNSWKNYTTFIDAQVRLNLLSKQFSQKQYLTVLFHNFKYQITESKRKRHNILFHCIKAWKDNLIYKKFLMASSIQAMHFRKNADVSIIKSCFDALRTHKEQEKLIRVHHILHEQELPMINNLLNANEDIEVQGKFKAKQKACESVKKMLSKQLYGIFLHWKNLTDDYKEKLRTTLRDKIIKLYMDKIRKSFTYWKSLDSQNQLMSQQMIIQDFQSDGLNLQNEVIDLQKTIKDKKDQLDCSQNKHVLKCVTSYQRRMKQLAIGRWRDRISEMNIKQDGAETIIRRLRLRFLRKAFDLYLDGVKFKKQEQTNEDRCILYNKTRNERVKKQVYNSWKIFINNHIKAKRYWNRMYIRLDLGMKQIAIKKWREWTQKQSEKELRDKQNDAISNIDDLNNEIGQLHQDETNQQMNINGLKKQLTTQARRIISNAFARFYYVSETRGIEKWKEFVEFEKRKEKLLKKYMDHMKKYQFYMVKAALQNWIQKCKINEKKELLKKEEQRLKDTQFQLDQQAKNYSGNNNQLNDELERVKKEQEIYNTRLQKSIQMIIKKVDNNDHMCQKRYILQMWRQYVQREVKLIKCVEKIMTKSFWSYAFTKIRLFQRNQAQHQNMSDKLNLFRMKFWKRTCGNAFSVWRSGQFIMIQQDIQDIQSDCQKQINDYQNKKAKFKGVNRDRSERIIQKNNLRNLFQGWKNVAQLLKFQNAKNEAFQEQTETFQKKMALLKWKQRKDATKIARVRTQRLKQKVYQIQLRSYFYVLREKFNISKQLISRLSNLARINDHHGLRLSFNAIQSYSNAKNFVHQTRKQNASKSVGQILEKLILRRKQQYLNDLRVKSLLKRKEHLVKYFTILNSVGNKLRWVFQKWKDTAAERTLALEMNEEGPIREEVFEANASLKNIKEYMEKEGYDQKDISDALQKEKNRQSDLLLKGVQRMKHYNEELYTLPMMLDRWKQFVHLRKLFKYWLQFADKRGEYIKCDLHQAFDTWRDYHEKQRNHLSKKKKDELDNRCIKNNRDLDRIAEEIDDRENILDLMNKQREALVENFIKGQKLALSLWLNHRKKNIHSSFFKWWKVAKYIKKMETLENLRNNLDLIERLKTRINQLEGDNDALANENEDLRQFSMDGYEIAKNVQALTAEREKLSVDLADKAQVIRKLLDENEKLTTKLRSAQDEAQNLIKSTLGGSSGYKNAGKGNPSPLQRSYY